MTPCEVCGNEYDKPIEVIVGGQRHTFDSFACAIHSLAPTCGHCGVRVISQGMEANGKMFCGAHCARAVGIDGLADRQ
jgi:hypothetical protein